MARIVSESIKKQVKEAVKTESDKKKNLPQEQIDTKKGSEQKPTSRPITSRPMPQSDSYIPKLESAKREDGRKEVKASIDTIVSGNASHPPDSNLRVIEALIDGSAPGQKSPSDALADASPQDSSQAYHQNPRGAAQDNPTDTYRNIANRAPGGLDGTRDIYRRDQSRDQRPQDNDNSIRQYVNKDSHARNIDARGQSDVFGTDEHTLSGRIRKMYSR